MNVRQRALEAKAAARILARQSRARKDAALGAIADALLAERAGIEAANDEDVRRARASGLSSALVERLVLSGERIAALARSVLHVAGLPDPVGSRGPMQRTAAGLSIGKQRLPLGLVAIIYESRPNVTVDAAALTLKSGNAVLLRGGKEAASTNRVLVDIMRRALLDRDLPEAAISFIPAGDREEIRELCGLTDLVDLAIPRGGEGLIRFVSEVARVPVIKHYKGVCHVYVDRDADLAMAEAIVLNAKCQRPAVCNAMETLLVDEPLAARFLPRLAAHLGERHVQLRVDPAAQAVLQAGSPGEAASAVVPGPGQGGHGPRPEIRVATEQDFFTEYNDLILNVRVVNGVDEAVAHINHFGSAHSDAVVTANEATARRFLGAVDSAAVYWNASTRFTDGGEFGMGAEIGISTDKVGARGPMGLEELTSYKWLGWGSGQVRT